MAFTIRKVRNREKYRLKIKDTNGYVILNEIFNNREDALDKVRNQMDKLVEEEKQQEVNETKHDVSENSDTEIEV